MNDMIDQGMVTVSVHAGDVKPGDRILWNDEICKVLEFSRGANQKHGRASDGWVNVYLFIQRPVNRTEPIEVHYDTFEHVMKVVSNDQ